jgi:hypothetical protein
MKEIRLIEQDEREKLHVFDLPLPVGVALIIGWVLLCAITFSYWDTKWSLLEAFYFFFISLRYERTCTGCMAHCYLMLSQ